MLRVPLTGYAADMTHSYGLITLCPPGAGCGAAPGASPPPPAPPATADLLRRAAALCAQARAAARAAPAPCPELLWLAEQLADTSRLLARLSRAGTIAADAYEQGLRDGEHATRPLPA